MKKILVLYLLLGFLFISCSKEDVLINNEPKTVDIDFDLNIEGSNSLSYSKVKGDNSSCKTQRTSTTDAIEASKVLNSFITVTVKVGEKKTYTFRKENLYYGFYCEESPNSTLNTYGQLRLKQVPCGNYEIKIFAQSSILYNDCAENPYFGVYLFHGDGTEDTKSQIEEVVNYNDGLYRVYECVDTLNIPAETSHMFSMKPINNLFAINVDRSRNLDTHMYIAQSARNRITWDIMEDSNSWLAWYMPCNNNNHTNYTTIFQDES